MRFPCFHDGASYKSRFQVTYLGIFKCRLQAWRITTWLCYMDAGYLKIKFNK